MKRSGLSGLMISFAICLIVASCSDDHKWRYIDPPDVSKQPLTLKVAYVENERFASMDAESLRAVLDRTVEMTAEHLGIEVRFSDIDTIPIQSFFNNLVYEVKQARAGSMIDPDTMTEAQRARLRVSIYETLENYWNDREMVTDFARPYLVNPLPEDDFHKLADGLVETLLERLSYWYDVRSDDGEPVLDSTPYNEWVWWDSLGYGNVPYDVVITNQLVASAEFYGMDVHSSLRGGISAGTTTYSKAAQFRSFSWIMLYPMLNDNDVLSRLRDDDHYDETQRVEYAAALLTHELGHLLLHLGHPFGNHNCIMSPTPLLKYRKWVDELDAVKCPVGSEEQMMPGAAKIEYHLDW